MTMPAAGPFLFGELKGTSWHRRFIAEEYRIFLDHYPNRSLISDYSLSAAELEETARLIEYYKLITELFISGGKIDKMTPFELLGHLREFRASVYGGKYRTGFRVPKKKLRHSAGFSRDGQLDSLIAELKDADNIIYFPPYASDTEDDLFFLSGISSAPVRLYRPEEILPVRDDFLKMLEQSVADGSFILIADIWVYLDVFRRIGRTGLLLDNSEWFAHGLFQDTNPRAVIAGIQSEYFPGDIDVSGVQFCRLSLDSFLFGRKPEELPETISGRIRELLSDNFRFSLKSGFYFFSDESVVETRPGSTDAVMITTAVIKERDAECRPLLLSGCTPPESLPLKGSGLLTSFNYYFTDNLRELYNKETSIDERISFSDFFIDYIYYSDDGLYPETLPLYSKALLGCSRSGKLFAGHYCPEAIMISAGEISLRFNQEQINPDGDGSATGIYLPSSERSSAGTGCEAFVLINNRIIHQGTGPFKIPPAGAVVVSEPRAVFSEETEIRISVSFAELPVPKNQLRWLCGGFNLLIKNGINMYKDSRTAETSLRAEGWYSESSKKTQETQLLPGIRQPRLVFGRTVCGELFVISFSGRTHESAGASFENCALFAEKIISQQKKKIDFLINFDGGASASITAFHNTQYYNLTHTAPSESNPAGVQRPTPAYFILREQATTGE